MHHGEDGTTWLSSCRTNPHPIEVVWAAIANPNDSPNGGWRRTTSSPTRGTGSPALAHPVTCCLADVTCNIDCMAVKDRVGEYRRRMRARGYRPVQIWVPDVRTQEFAAEARRQSALVAQADSLGDDQEFIEAVSVPWDEE